MRRREDAERAILGLHDTRRLGESAHPLQVKPATSESQKLETKLFVGLVPKSANEETLRNIFKQFGKIEDVAILRAAEGVSKGCGFVRFATRASAQAAINALNQKFTPPVRIVEGNGCDWVG